MSGPRVNLDIKARKIKLVGQENAELNRVMTREEGLKIAREVRFWAFF